VTTEPAMPPRDPATDVGAGPVGTAPTGDGPIGAPPLGHPAAGDVPTGDSGVRAASARLDELPGLPVAEHVAVFEEVHRMLAGILAELDAADGAEGSGPGGVVSAGARPPGPARPGQPPRPGVPGQPAGRSWPGAAPGGGPRPGPPLPGLGGPR
jgi:hypothetical protein